MYAARGGALLQHDLPRAVVLVAKIRPRNQTPTSSTAGTKLRPGYMEALEKELAGLVKKLKSNQVESAL